MAMDMRLVDLLLLVIVVATGLAWWIPVVIRSNSVQKGVLNLIQIAVKMLANRCGVWRGKSMKDCVYGWAGAARKV